VQPAPSPPRNLGRRWIARLVDWLLVLVVTSPVWVVAVGHLKHSAAFTATSFADDGVLGALSLRWGDVGDSAYAGASEVWGSVSSTVIATAAVQVSAVALYDFVAHAWLGRTLGKALVSLSVEPVDGARRVRPGRALVRSALTVLLPGAGWVVLIAAVLRLDFLLALLGVALLALSLAECLSLRGRLPWRLEVFLVDACRLEVLRRFGSTHQFRHLALQHRLAARPGPGPPAPR